MSGARDVRLPGGAGARERVAIVHTASAASFEDIAVTGSGAPPSVVLHGPHGQSVIPVGLARGSLSAGRRDPGAEQRHDVCDVRNPGGGTWTVSGAAGSSTITAVNAARGYTPPTIRAHVTGHGTTRRLTYSVSTQPGQSVTFAERSKDTYHLLGAATHARGTLRFTPAQGAAGERAIDAIVSDDGVQREIVAVASYRAPGPITPGRVHGLRVRRKGRQFQVRFASASGAAYYVLSIRASDGRHLLRLIHRSGHVVNLPVLGYTDHIKVAVLGVSGLGRRGKSATAHV